MAAGVVLLGVAAGVVLSGEEAVLLVAVNMLKASGKLAAAEVAFVLLAIQMVYVEYHTHILLFGLLAV